MKFGLTPSFIAAEAAKTVLLLRVISFMYPSEKGTSSAPTGIVFPACPLCTSGDLHIFAGQSLTGPDFGICNFLCLRIQRL